jgi:hypothetical protein
MLFRTPVLALALVGMFVCAAEAQTLYRWTDADGKVHYTDTPPPNSAKASRTVNTDSAADQKAAETLKEQNEAIVKRSVERNKTPAEREREKKEEERRSRCAQLSTVVTALDRGDPVFRGDDKGGKAELSKQDRDFEKLRTGQQFQMECSDIAKEAATAAAKSRAANAAAPAENPQSAAKSATPAK